MKISGRTLLLVAAGCSGFVTLLHVALAIFGPPWYRYFGAPSLADRIEAGAALVPILLTVAVAAVEAVAVARGALPMRFAMFSTFSAFVGVMYLWGVLSIGRGGPAPETHAS